MIDRRLFTIIRKLEEITRLLREIAEPPVDAPEPIEIDVAFLNVPVTALDLGKGYTARFRHACEGFVAWNTSDTPLHAPLVTVRDVVALTEQEWMREPNISKKTVQALKDVLAPHGLYLGMDLQLRRVA